MPRSIRSRSLVRTMVVAGVIASVVLAAPTPASAIAPTIRSTGPLSLILGYPTPIQSSAGLPLLINDTDSVRSEVTLAVAGATPGTAMRLNLPVAAGLAFSVGDGVDDATLTFSGLRTDVNAALASATVLARSGAAGQSITVVADDNPTSAVGGTDTETIPVAVSDVDPVVAVPASLTIGTAATRPLGTAASLSATDADGPQLFLSLGILPGNPNSPQLSVPAIAGLAGSGGSPSLTLNLSGPAATVQQGLRAVLVHGGATPGAFSITVALRDAPVSANEVKATIALTVTDLPPTISASPATIGVGAATPVTATVADPDSPRVEVFLSAAQSGVPLVAFPRITVGTTTGLELHAGTFTGATEVSFAGTLAAVNAALASVEIVGGTSGAASFFLDVDDDPGATTFRNVDRAEVALTVIEVPSAPTNVVAVASGDRMRLTFSAPATAGDEAIDGYRIYRTIGGTTAPVATSDGTATSVAFDTEGYGTSMRFSVAPITTSGAFGPRSALSASITPQRFAPYASVDAEVTGLYADLLGRAPTASERSATAALITGGPRPSSAIGPIRSTTESQQTVDAVTRLYRAYFLRIPDAGGLRFWLGRKRTGTKLDAISQSFASSSEFRTRYGSLTNRQFVELIYQNLFGRAGDAAGVAFWTGQLDSGKRNRGSVMAGFSESSEYKRKQAAPVEVSALYILLLGRAPTPTEFDAGVAMADPSLTSFHSFVLSSPLLDARVP